MLNKFAFEIEENMTTREYMNWLRYFQEKERKQQAQSGNVLAMDEEEMIGALTGGGSD